MSVAAERMATERLHVMPGERAKGPLLARHFHFRLGSRLHLRSRLRFGRLPGSGAAG
ncbi:MULTISPECIES: hypothetical protein [unclassified Streptomyces]|uniref:hypothetical protein n=1 Tax=unclassified Streptomyces TaxID=2593676 RepID=UPI001319E1A7|nr:MULTISPECIES: hypothetical protein [unclassified Streptomyces]MYT34260.1 hypothetical protein [Streptomyces sp. SID8354]